MNDVITALNGSITPAPVNSELYRDFLNRKADDVITALNGSITPAPAGDELYRDFIERKFDDVISGIGGYLPPLTFPTLTGSIVTFNSQYAGLPLKSHKVAVTATQSGSGTPSPSNPRPISGYSAINISHSDADTSNPTVYTITIGSTVYGGEYDARTGVFKVTHKGILARDVSGWAKSGSVFYRNFSDVWTAITPDTPTGRKPLLCSHFDYSNSSIIADLKIGYGGANNNGNIVIRYDALSTISDFNDYITNNDVFIVYELATPQTIQLPLCPIDTLEGVNNIWADTGDTTLQYIKIGGNN